MIDSRKKEILIKKAEMLKIIAHPMRLCIINCLLESAHNVNSLAERLGLPQSTVSQHLSKLKMGGIVVGERNGVEIAYRVVSQEVTAIIHLMVEQCEEEIFKETAV